MVENVEWSKFKLVELDFSKLIRTLLRKDNNNVLNKHGPKMHIKKVIRGQSVDWGGRAPQKTKRLSHLRDGRVDLNILNGI